MTAAGVFVWRGPRQAPPDTVAAVERRDLDIAVMATGRLRPRDFVDVGAQVSGQLSRLSVGIGDQVAAGDLLAEVDAEVEAAEVEALRAERDGLHAELDEQQADLGDADILGADAGMAQIRDEAVEEGAAVGLDMIEDRGECVRGSHNNA